MRSGGEHDALIDQASAWLIGLDTGRVDQAAFERWRSQSPRHAAAFAQVAATWKQTADLRAFADAAVPEPEAEVSTPAALNRRSFVAAGAAVIAGVVGGGLWLRHDDRQAVETAFRERRSLPLPDGSTVALNSDTLLHWRFDDRRALWIDRGECAIDIAREAVRPFLLHGASFRAGLAAGRYDLRLLPDGATLAVLAGAAQVVLGAGAPRTIAAGRLLSWRGRAVTDKPLTNSDAARIEAWRRGELLFDGMTLAQAVAEFNRYLPQKLVVTDRETAAVRLGGRFMIDDPESFLRALRDGFGIASRADGQVIRLAR